MKTKLLFFAACVLIALGWAVTDDVPVERPNPRGVVLQTAADAGPTDALPANPSAPMKVDHHVEVQVQSSFGSAGQSEMVRDVLKQIAMSSDWASRAQLAKELRSVSDPSALQLLLPALLESYGRGNTIFNEISDAVARLADAATVETLEVMHWEASAHAGQGRKILRTVAAIRNPPARKALAKLAAHAESPALAACAEEALKAMNEMASR